MRRVQSSPMAFILLAALALFSSAAPYRLEPLAPATPCPREPLWTVYEVACYGTETPPELLRAIAVVESDERDSATGDDGESLGRFQDRKKYHAWRESLYGPYDPRDAQAAARVYALELEAHYRLSGDWDIAVAAHRQGLKGARTDGPTAWYLERVRSHLPEARS